MADTAPALAVCDLTVTAGARRRTILDIPELDLAPGTALGVRGPSGAGKSTLLFALAGLIDGASGQIRWGDADILSLGEEGRRLSGRIRSG